MDTTMTAPAVYSSHTVGGSWLPVLALMFFGCIAAIALIILCWRAGKGKGVGLLAIVTVAVALLLFVVLLSLRLERPGGTGPAAAPHWAIGVKIIMLLLAGMVIGSIIVLIARFFAWLGAADPAGAAVNPEERKRILGMVEQGKMTGSEGAELLDALGKSSALRGQQTFGRLDVAILVTVSIVVLGFFLPWQYIYINGMQAHQSGHQIGAQGWAVLICAVLAALLVFITPREHLYKLALLQVLSICVGLALIISVWWGAGSHVGAGTVICCLGFTFTLIMSGMKLRALGR